MTLALSIAGASCVLFVVCSWVFAREKRTGRRFFLSSLRQWLDTIITTFVEYIHRSVVYVTKYIITLSWYYSLHAFLGVVLKFLASVYYLVENITHRNRDKARKIRQERKQGTRSHLDMLVDHKDDTKLTEQQKKKLKDKALNQK